MKKLYKVSSYKTFQKELLETQQKLNENKLPNYFTLADDRKHFQYLQKSFQPIQPVKRQKSPQEQNFLNRLSHSGYFCLNNSQPRKPLNQILEGKQNSPKTLSKSFKQKLVHETSLKKKSQSSCEKSRPRAVKSRTDKNHKLSHNKTHLYTEVSNFSHNKTHLYAEVSNFDYDKATRDNLILNRLKNSMKHISNLKSEKISSSSKSNKKKGLECTLYERSLQKKINETNVKSSKKMVSFKSKYQKTEKQMGQAAECQKKDLKRILLKKKNPEDSRLTSTNCFKYVILQKSQDKTKIQTSNLKIQGIAELNRSLTLVNRSLKKQFQRFSNSKQKSQPKSLDRKTQNDKGYSKQKSNSKARGSKNEGKRKKVTINQKTRKNLDKIHTNYKFILNYLSDFDIIGKLNGYQLAGTEECKWILLVIDDVYELIKHADQTKLKGMECTRDYEFKSGQKANSCAKQKKVHSYKQSLSKVINNR